MGARRPGATSTRRSWSTTSASTTRSTRVASMVMGTMISKLRVSARARARMKASTRRRGSIRMRWRTWNQSYTLQSARLPHGLWIPAILRREEGHVEDHINAAQTCNLSRGI